MWDPFEDREDGDSKGIVAEEPEHTWFRDEWISSNATPGVSNVLGAQYEGADKEQNWYEATTDALRHSISVSH